jgi:hypothetical protein
MSLPERIAMAKARKTPVTLQKLVVSSLAQSDALAKLLMEKGIISQEELQTKFAEERVTYQRLLNPTTR